MGRTTRNHERWIWTELIGFDNRQPDFGVREYLDNAGFTPDAVSLLLSSIDVVLQHQGMGRTYRLPPDVCSREGHEHNQNRKRQKWTNVQLRGLVRQLQEQGVAVYLNVFNQYHNNRHHHEWASDHAEVRAQYLPRKHRGDIHILKRLADGTPFEDLFLPRLVEVMQDYGFDGWHGGDGFGDVGGPIYAIDASDDLVGQFQAASSIALPPEVAGDCGDDHERLTRRATWIWQNRRHEWIEFYAARSTRFWQKAVDLLHRAGKKAAINSCRARDPFETLYMNGYDYRRLATTGVDAIVTETVAAGLALDPRSDCSGPHRHDDFLAQLLLIKACMPKTKLIFLHNLHDIVEQWDAIHHAPTVLEREIYTLANLCHVTRNGKLRRCADGFLACLGDGIRHEEWQWLQRRWDLAFGPLPRRQCGATVIWSDAAMDHQIADFTATRTWPTHRILYHLMAAGAPVQAVARSEALAGVQGAILVLNLHLFPEAERQQVLAYRNGPVIVVTRKGDPLPAALLRFDDVYPPHELSCAVWGAKARLETPIAKDGDESIPVDLRLVADTAGFWDHLYQRHVSSGFIDACVDAIAQVTGGFLPGTDRTSNAVLLSELANGRLRLVVKSRVHVYTSPTIDLQRPIRTAKVLTEFPLMPPRLEGSKLTVRVPPNGIVVMEVVLEA
jgi:hypothetical protein